VWDLGPGIEMVGKETKGMMDLEKGGRAGRMIGFHAGGFWLGVLQRR